MTRPYALRPGGTAEYRFAVERANPLGKRLTHGMWEASRRLKSLPGHHWPPRWPHIEIETSIPGHPDRPIECDLKFVMTRKIATSAGASSRLRLGSHTRQAIVKKGPATQRNKSPGDIIHTSLFLCRKEHTVKRILDGNVWEMRTQKIALTPGTKPS